MRVGIEAASFGDSWARIQVIISGGRDGIVVGEVIVFRGRGRSWEGKRRRVASSPTFDPRLLSFLLTCVVNSTVDTHSSIL